MTNYKTLLCQAFAVYEGQEYRASGKDAWGESGTVMPRKFSSAILSQQANLGAIPTTKYTDHLIACRKALTTLIEGSAAGTFPQMSEDILEAAQSERNSIDNTMVANHMLLAAKVIHRHAVGANQMEVEDMLAKSSGKIVQCLSVENRDCTFSTYLWTAIKNLVFRFMSDPSGWDTVALLDDSREDESQTSRVCMPGQMYMEQVPDDSPGPVEQLQDLELLSALGEVLRFRTEFLSEQEDLILASWSGLGHGIGGEHRVSQSIIAAELGLSNQHVHGVLVTALTKVEEQLSKINSGTTLSFFQKYIE